MSRSLALTLVFSFLFALTPSFSQISSEPFEFQFEQKTLRGLIEKPVDQPSQAVIIIIPGYGETNFVEGNWYSGLREKLVSYGLTVCLWDKMGCGNSEGVFNAQQPVENSAEEAIAAIQQLKKLNIPGSDKIGFWSISRAGWIVPLINEKFPIEFWISVSGTDDKENFGYLVKSNLLIAGKEEEEAERLYQAWMEGHRIFCNEGSLEDNIAAIRPLLQDSTSRRLFGYQAESALTEEDRKKYVQNQQLYTSKGYYDTESGLWVVINDFDKTLLNINCPVLAIFGANDSQVDWRKTKKLYEETIGTNPASELTVSVFEQCNHSLQKCISCAWGEDLSSLQWQACDNYYETMEEWLRDHQYID